MAHDERDPRDDDLRALQLLDPAHRPRPDAGRGQAAQAMLARILDEPAGGARPVRADGAHRRWGRWALAGTAAAAVAAGLVLLPPWGTPEHAFASWTPVPEEAPAAVEDQIAEQCSNELAMDVLDQEVIIAEERGRVTFGLLSRSGSLSHCLLVDGAWHMSGGGATSTGGSGSQLAPEEVQTVLTAGAGTGAEAYTTITGRVGADVVGVEVHPRGPLEQPGALPDGELPESVTATVENGYYGAWWPGIGVEDVELTVHLSDGTVLPDIPVFDE